MGGWSPYRSITSSLKDALYAPPKQGPPIPQSTLDRIRKLTQYGPPRTYPPGDPRFAGPPAPVGPSRLAGPSFTRASGQRDVDPDSDRALGALAPLRAFGKLNADIGERSAGGYAAVGRELGINDFPGSNVLRPVANELLNPLTLASTTVPFVKGPTVARAALTNAAVQGGVNVGLDVSMGRTSPEQLATSLGAGAALGGVLSPGVLSALTEAAKKAGMPVADFIRTPAGRRMAGMAQATPSGERGALDLGDDAAREKEWLAKMQQEGKLFHGSAADPNLGRASPGDESGFFTVEEPSIADFYANSDVRNAEGGKGTIYASDPPKKPLIYGEDRAGQQQLYETMKAEADRLDNRYMDYGDVKPPGTFTRAVDAIPKAIEGGNPRLIDSAFRNASLEHQRMETGSFTGAGRYLNRLLKEAGYDAYVTLEKNPALGPDAPYHRVVAFVDRPSLTSYKTAARAGDAGSTSLPPDNLPPSPGSISQAREAVEAARAAVESNPLKNEINEGAYRFGVERTRPVGPKRVPGMKVPPGTSRARGTVRTTVDQVRIDVEDVRRLRERGIFVEQRNGEWWRDVEDWQEYLDESHSGEAFAEVMPDTGYDLGASDRRFKAFTDYFQNKKDLDAAEISLRNRMANATPAQIKDEIDGQLAALRDDWDNLVDDAPEGEVQTLIDDIVERERISGQLQRGRVTGRARGLAGLGRSRKPLPKGGMKPQPVPEGPSLEQLRADAIKGKADIPAPKAAPPGKLFYTEPGRALDDLILENLSGKPKPKSPKLPPGTTAGRPTLADAAERLPGGSPPRPRRLPTDEQVATNQAISAAETDPAALDPYREFFEGEQPGAALPIKLEDKTGDALSRFVSPKHQVPAPPVSLITVTNQLDKVEDFLKQSSRTADELVTAQKADRLLKDQYAAQATRRAAVAKAQAPRSTVGGTTPGMTTPPRGLITQNQLAASRKAVAQARLNKIKAGQALREADVLASDEDIVTRYERVSGDDADPKLGAALMEMGRWRTLWDQLHEPFLGIPTWRQHAWNILARAKGTVPGPVDDMIHGAMSYEAALAEGDRWFVENSIAPMERLLNKESRNLIFRGQKKFADLAMTDRLHYIYTNPEDFVGKSMELQRLLREAEAYAKQRYQLLEQLNPKVAPPVDGRYLPQMWEAARGHIESVRRPRGRPPTTKARTIRDWREAKISKSWDKEFVDMSPGELMEYSIGATRQTIADSWFRREVLKKYGTTVKPKVGSGMVAARNPLFAGWYLPQEIADQVDVLFEPGPEIVRSISTPLHVLQNMRFAVDFSVAGYNLMQALAVGNVNITAGLMHRGLLALRHGDPALMADDLLSPRVRGALHGRPVGGAESPIAPRAGTALQWIPKVGEAVDRPITKAVSRWNGIQYGTIMQGVRDLAADGNRAMAKFVGADMEDISVLRALEQNAAALTGSSQGAARVGRREIESASLSSARITRSQFALIGQVLKRPKNRAEALMAAQLVASLGVTVYGVGLAANMIFGDQPFEFLPFSVENGKPKYNPKWATIAIKGRRYNLIPQRSLANTIAKSIYAVSIAEPKELAQVWAQYGYSRLSPGGQGPPTAAGFGFGEEGFEAGTLSAKDRLMQSIPVPVTAGSAIRGDVRNARTLGESITGVSSYQQGFAEQGRTAINAGADWEDAYQKAIASGDLDTAQKITTAERGNFAERNKASGVTVVPGAYVEDPNGNLARAPRVEIAEVEALWERYRLLYPKPEKSYIDQRQEYVDARKVSYMQLAKVTEPVARDVLSKRFDALPASRNFNDKEKQIKLAFWRRHPMILYDAWLLGLEETNEDERGIIERVQKVRR